MTAPPSAAFFRVLFTDFITTTSPADSNISLDHMLNAQSSATKSYSLNPSFCLSRLSVEILYRYTEIRLILTVVYRSKRPLDQSKTRVWRLRVEIKYRKFSVSKELKCRVLFDGSTTTLHASDNQKGSIRCHNHNKRNRVIIFTLADQQWLRILAAPLTIMGCRVLTKAFLGPPKEEHVAVRWRTRLPFRTYPFFLAMARPCCLSRLHPLLAPPCTLSR